MTSLDYNYRPAKLSFEKTLVSYQFFSLRHSMMGTVYTYLRSCSKMFFYLPAAFSLHLMSAAPIMKGVGCYVDETNKRALLFASDQNLTLVSGEQAFTQALVRIYLLH